MNARRVRSGSGFTLIELLLVVVILLTTTGLIAVSFSGSFRATRLRTAGRDVIATGRYARARSVLDGRTAVLRVNPAAGTMEVWVRSARAEEGEPGDEPGAVMPQETETPFEPTGIRRALAEGLRFVRLEKPDAPDAVAEVFDIHFYPSGASERVLIRVEDDADGTMELTLDAVGNWKVEP